MLGRPEEEPTPSRSATPPTRSTRTASLGELRDKGLITPAEFDEQKARLLREI